MATATHRIYSFHGNCNILYNAKFLRFTIFAVFTGVLDCKNYALQRIINFLWL